MLRRFESYAFHDTTSPAQVAELARVLLRAGDFIPEVRFSAVGKNRSDATVELVWEHAYDGPDAYARYMCHPYHICVLDRYLLPESPECITASRPEAGLGLFGYETDGAPFRRDGGIRRVVAMKANANLDADQWDTFVSELIALPTRVPEMRVSVVGRNSMGLDWFPDGWTHIWEQAYDDEQAMQRARAAEAEALDAAPIERCVDVWYRMGTDALMDEP